MAGGYRDEAHSDAGRNGSMGYYVRTAGIALFDGAWVFLEGQRSFRECVGFLLALMARGCRKELFRLMGGFRWLRCLMMLWITARYVWALTVVTMFLIAGMWDVGS